MGLVSHGNHDNLMGSYQMFKAEKDPPNFQVSVLTSIMGTNRSLLYFSQYIYESILKTVDSDIKFETEVAPLPVF